MTDTIKISTLNELIVNSTQIGWVLSINANGRVMSGVHAPARAYPQTAFYPLERDSHGRPKRGKKVILDVSAYRSESPDHHTPNPALIEAISAQ